MQQLEVSLSIPVPAEFVLVNKIEFEELKEQSLSGSYWNMKQLEEKLGRKHEWIKENVLYPTRFRKVLDSENGGCVYYPKIRGENWSFHAVEMARFLDRNFNKIFNQ